MASEFPDDRQPTPGDGMAARIKSILLEPKAEWPRIEAEPMTVGDVFKTWVVPLAAIGPVAGLIGGLVFGYGAFGFVYRPSVSGAVTSAVLSYALSLISVWVLSLIIDGLAPTFGGVKNPVAAMKVAAFSMTASWLAGVFQLFPPLAVLAILGLYSFYLLYLGLPRLMKAPEDKAVGYTVVTIVAGAVLFLLVGAITGAVVARTAGPVFRF